jgi:hypothetical protein
MSNSNNNDILMIWQGILPYLFPNLKGKLPKPDESGYTGHFAAENCKHDKTDAKKT